MKKSSKKRSDSTSSSSSSASSSGSPSRAPPPPRNRPRTSRKEKCKTPPPQRKNAGTGKSASGKKVEPPKSEKKRPTQPKTRTSPRRRCSTSSAGDHVSHVPVPSLTPMEIAKAKASASLSAFRIPKIKSAIVKENEISSGSEALQLQSESELSKSNDTSLQQKARVKTDMRPRVLIPGCGVVLPGGPSSSTAFGHFDKEKDAQLTRSTPLARLVKKGGKDQEVLFDKIRTAVADKQDRDTLFNKFQSPQPVDKPHKIEALKAKRRLGSLAQAPISICTALESETKEHAEKQGEIQSEAISSVKIFPDLPDYADSEGEEPEGMEWENPVPQILKLVKEASNFPDCGQKTFSAQDQSRLGTNNVEMYGEEMDVDPDPAEQLVIVPDTNIWIGNINLIKRLLEEKFPRVSQPTIIIPWMVLQELDVGLHRTNQDKDKARQPVNFIYSLLSSKHPRVKGQRASDAAISQLKFNELMADDSILNCVFQLQKNNNIVIFLTNDRNLLNKALVNGVIASDSQSALQKINDILSKNTTTPTAQLDIQSNDIPEPLKPSLITQASSMNSFSQNSRIGTKRKPDAFIDLPVLPSLSDSLSTAPFDSMEQDDDPMTGCEGPPATKIRAFGDEFPSSAGTESLELFEALRLAFSYIIRWKMVDDYGMGGWEFALKIKPPWTLKTSIKCILTHWIANFSFVFSRKGKSHVEKLASLVEDYKSTSPADRAAVENSVVETSLALFNLTDKALMNEFPVLTCRQLLMSYAISNRT